MCQGSRPIVLYAHGTSTAKIFNIAASSENTTGQSLAIVFAARGYIVVAPNYAGYDCSELPYHPYLNARQQSEEMLDALSVARRALPVATPAALTRNRSLPERKRFKEYRGFRRCPGRGLKAAACACALRLFHCLRASLGLHYG